MYLKLGNTNIKYITEINDFFIISEIIDSDISYEKPILVRSIDELDIWFGKSFSDRNYFEELLRSGITLFLYRPTSTKINNNSLNYYDLSSYQIDSNYYLYIEDIKNPLSNVIYNIYDISGDYLDKNGLRYNKFIYTEGSLVNIKDLPQNIDKVKYSDSQLNRDTLRLFDSKYNGPKFTHPKYSSNEVIYTEVIDYELLSNNLPDLKRVDLGYETLSFDMDLSDLDINNNSYIIIKDKTSRRVLIIFKKDENFKNTLPDNSYYDSEVYINLNQDKEIIVNEFLDTIKGFGYRVDELGNFTYNIYTSFKLDCNYFYTTKGLNLVPNYQITHNILSKFSENDGIIEFFSKTVGFDEEKIKIRIENLKNSNYRITLTKYDYSEVYEGSIFWKGVEKESRLDNLINSNSKLVYCNINDRVTEETELLTDYWELSRSVKEENSIDNYWNSIKIILDEDLSRFIDFFLIPNIYNYITGLDDDFNYYKEYEDFLNLAKNTNCQILVQNSDYGDRFIYEEVEVLPENPKEGVVYIYENLYYEYKDNIWVQISDLEITNKYRNNFIFNYTKDKDNRIVYFYRPLIVVGNNRPGYYLFIKSLIEEDIYSASSKDIIYDQPKGDPYDNFDEGLRKDLEKYKSNYLTFNNLFYFYRNYQNGDNFNTTIWMRFCLGKITRELEKNKWNFLSKRFTGEVIKNISSILENITDTYSIIRSIEITNYEFDFKNKKLNLSIYSKMSDLVDNNISLDITLNYND